MLALLGLVTILVLLAVILTKRMSPLIALILIRISLRMVRRNRDFLDGQPVPPADYSLGVTGLC